MIFITLAIKYIYLLDLGSTPPVTLNLFNELYKFYVSIPCLNNVNAYYKNTDVWFKK